MSETVAELVARIKAEQADHLAKQQAALDDTKAAALARMQVRRQEQQQAEQEREQARLDAREAARKEQARRASGLGPADFDRVWPDIRARMAADDVDAARRAQA